MRGVLDMFRSTRWWLVDIREKGGGRQQFSKLEKKSEQRHLMANEQRHPYRLRRLDVTGRQTMKADPAASAVVNVGHACLSCFRECVDVLVLRHWVLSRRHYTKFYCGSLVLQDRHRVTDPPRPNPFHHK